MPQSSRRLRERRNGLCGCLKVFFCLVFFLVCTYSHARTATHVQPRTYGHARAKEWPVWLFMARSLKVFFFFCTYGHARTATHVRARESEETACVVVVSGTRFERFFFFLHVRPCTYGHTLVYITVHIWGPWCKRHFFKTSEIQVKVCATSNAVISLSL